MAGEADLTGQTQAGYAVTGAVRVLRWHVTAGEFAQMRAALPAEISALLTSSGS
ncbi:MULTISPECIES: hypothetical protein [unclassified Pseudofrankia]|uniref:hypothetical protein n=1 Tax=unclassified Pseudofrankia TaxID=2994372 RepID=UPI0018E3104D|nr:MULTISPECIES: hypothetical protein [unclassified Pseudofrankia]MDT3446683.1 hypothetical protein [Pseudofrankia sp. BMG5.37]